jgi:hypothetical protein
MRTSYHQLAPGNPVNFLINAAVYVLYAIAGCAVLSAVVAQRAFFGKVGRIGLHPPLTPSQIKKIAIFGLLLFIAFLALVAGRSLDLGRAPF